MTKMIHIVAGNEYHTRMLEDYRTGGQTTPLALVFGRDDEEAEERAYIMGASYDMLEFLQAIAKGEFMGAEMDAPGHARDILREIGVL